MHSEAASDLDELPPALQPVLLPILLINIAAMNLRLVFRVLAFKQVYGRYDFTGVLLRWPVAVLRPWGLEAPYSRFVARALDRIASAEPLTEKSAARWWRLRS